MLEKSLAVLKPGGKLISISGPPDPAFARAVGANWFVRQVLRLASFKIRHKAKKRGVDYSFLFMHADGAQLARIAELVDDGVLRPVIDKEFPFDRTPEAVARVEQGHGAGKVVIEVAEDGPATGADARAVATPIGIEPAVVPDRSDTLTTGRLALLASLAALGALATNIMLPAFPAIALELGVAPRELAWTLSSFFIVFAVGQLFVGPLSDTLGRARLVLGGLIVFVAGSIVCTLAPSLPVLIAGRAIQALGACAASVLARAIARDLYHGPELTRALALVMIAMAAAPGFSPALGTGMTLAFGWRSTFVLVAVAGVLVALHYRLGAGETLPVDRRRPAHPLAIARTYRDLSIDPRFIAPALTVSLIIGCLYSFFGAAPAILMTGMGLSSTGLSIFFAATVLVVFGSGLLTGRLVARWGAPRVGMAGLLVAAVGGLWLLLQGGAAAPAPFMAAVTLFLAGMGFVNPVGTAIALEPFGDRAGIASALLGFLQMSCAAIGTALIGALPVSPATAYAWVVFGGTLLATGAFLPAMGIRYTTVSRSEVEP